MSERNTHVCQLKASNGPGSCRMRCGGDRRRTGWARAAVSAARNGASVTLLERYHHLGGMASGGMVLVLDDMVNEGNEIVTTGLVMNLLNGWKSRMPLSIPPRRMPDQLGDVAEMVALGLYRLSTRR